jgi:hypothetical protein
VDDLAEAARLIERLEKAGGTVRQSAPGLNDSVNEVD